MNAPLRHVSGARDITIQSVAQRMFDESDGDLNVATDKLVNYVRVSPRLTEGLLRIGARKLLNEIAPMQRRAIERQFAATSDNVQPFTKVPHRMNDGTRRAQERIRSLGRHHREALLDMPYTINGRTRPLRQWTGVEIATHGETELSKGMTAVKNARFLIAVGQAAGEARVGDALTASDIARLKEQTESAA
jgi:hypothetical protein